MDARTITEPAVQPQMVVIHPCGMKWCRVCRDRIGVVELQVFGRAFDGSAHRDGDVVGGLGSRWDRIDDGRHPNG